MHRRILGMIGLLAALLLFAAACTSSSSDGGGSDDTGSDADNAGTGTDTDTDTDDSGTDGDTVELTQGGDVLADVIANDVVRCGTRNALPGFAVLTDDGDHVGFDNDFCRVIAAGVLGDSTKVDYIDLETADRFTALQSGEIDVLVRNTTWTAGRDGTEGATFLQPNFYDGQGMMVASDSGYGTLTDLDGLVVCSAGGTTSEGNVINEFTRLGSAVEVLSFEDTDLLQEAFQAGRCDGWTSDVSQLVALRSEFPAGPDALTILDEVFSKEPLAPAVVDGQAAWGQVVNWAVFATIQAEEFGITSANVDEFLTSTDPNVQRFLGVEVDGATFDPGLGLPVDFNYQIIKQVGNYGEIYDEHIAPLGLPRGQNELWFNGGQLYAPPYR